MTNYLEIELKLEADPADREALESSQILDTSGSRADHLVSIYFDTPDQCLRKNGFSLRIRRTGEQRLQTVKMTNSASAGLFVRPEWERPLTDDTPVLDEASGPLLGTLGKDILSRIVPVFGTDVRRTIFEMNCAGARIECAIDNGEIRAGVQVEPICEVELELKDGPAEALFDLARTLNDIVPLRLGVRAKSERGYKLMGNEKPLAYKAEPITLGPQEDVGSAFVAIANSCIRQFRLNEELLIAAGAAESLHQARVGLRRLRSVFSLYKPLFAADEKAQLLSPELRRLAALLGEVRNIDVLIPRVDDDVREQLIAARDGLFEHVHAELISSRTRLLMIDLTEWLMLGAWRNPGDESALQRQNIMLFARELLDARRKRLKRRGKGLADLSDADRHKVRIEAKKLRYATEFHASLYAGKKGKRRQKAFLEALEMLQDHLGELNDLATGPEVLAKLGIERKLPDAGKAERRRLLDGAEDAYNVLVDTKRFWHS